MFTVFCEPTSGQVVGVFLLRENEKGGGGGEKRGGEETSEKNVCSNKERHLARSRRAKKKFGGEPTRATNFTPTKTFREGP